MNLRFALRSLRKSPAFVTVAVLSIALGIGANTAIFTLTDQLLIRMLPVKHPEELVMLSAIGQHYGNNMGWNRISYPMYQDFRDRNQVFKSMFCFREVAVSVAYGGRTERITGELVSGNYFPVLGVEPAIGRLFTADDDRVQKGQPVAVLSYGYWLRRFGGSPGVIGQKLIINGYPFTVVGVSHPGYSGTDPSYAPEVRMPMMMAPVLGKYMNLNDRRSRWVTAFARLKPGMTVESAKAGLQPLFHQILDFEVTQPAFAKTAPEMKQKFLKMSMDVLPAGKGRSYLRRQLSKPLLVLTATVGLVLLISCANVANLMIARAAARQKEIAIRLALGAARTRIIGQLLIESLMLSVTGGITGLLLAIWIDKTLIGFFPPSTTPLVISAWPDWRILAFNLGLSVVTGIVFGLVPALQATRPDVAPTLKDQAGSVTSGTSVRLRKGLVVAQVSLSLLLLIGAGLFIRSLNNLKYLDPGFHTSNLLAFKVDPTLNAYPEARTKSFYQQLQQRLSTLPAVQSVSMAVVAVLENDEWDSWVTIDTYKPKAGELPDPHMNFVSPGHFQNMGTPLLVGRDFRLTDTLGSQKVAIVNESFAKKYFGSVNAVGHMFGMGIDPGTKIDITIVGVVRDTKYESMRDEIPIEVFRPFQQMDFVTGMTVYIRTVGDPQQIFSLARKTVQEIDPNLPIFRMTTLEKQKDDSMLTERLVALLSSAFGFLATLLAAIGLYGVMAYTVERRTREIGIRMAIGALTGNVLWLVMREVMILLIAGIAIALPAALILSQYVRSQLYGIEPMDTASIALATLGIAGVATLAGFVPARRAASVDPIRALRYE
jgi:predicted permease